jgi:hypothetical protein
VTTNPRPRTLSLGNVRALVFVVCVGGIAGMIVGSIADDNSVAISFGLVTAAAAIGLMLVSAVTPADASKGLDLTPPDVLGGDIEVAVGALVASGADESHVRDLVRLAVRFGRTMATPREQ